MVCGRWEVVPGGGSAPEKIAHASAPSMNVTTHAPREGPWRRCSFQILTARLVFELRFCAIFTV